MELTTTTRKVLGAGALAFTALALSGCGADFELAFGEDGEGTVETRVFDVEDFSSVDLDSFVNADIMVDPSQPPSVSFETNPNLFDNLTVDVKNDTLRISMNSVSNADEARAIIVVPSLESIDADGAVSVDVVGVQESLIVDADGAVDINIEGKAGEEISRLEISADGATSISAGDVTATVVDVDIDGASSVDITATDSVTGSIDGAADLDVAGGAEVDVDVSGAASVNDDWFFGSD